jgi:HlyD family secretion protein
MVGTLERDRIELKVESDEPILSIHVQDGQRVAAGELVLVQDPARARARLGQLRGLHEQAVARLAELRRGPRVELINEARARLDAATAQRQNALATLQRTREIHARELASAEQLDRDETRHRDAVAQETAAREALERLLNGTTAEELRQAEAAVQAAAAQVESAELDLARTRLLAPGPGTVDKVLYQVGERPPRGTTIAVLLSADRTFARVYVPAELRASVRPGTALEVRVDGITEAFSGRVRWVSADASFTPYFALTEHDRSRLSYLAEIDLEGADELPSGVPLQAAWPRR